MLPPLFVQKVDQTIKRHRMARPGDRILAAVSGGIDSVCMARTLEALGYELGLAHINHGLRGTDSELDEEFVRRLAESLGVPFFGRRIEPAELVGNQEEAGRMIRREFLRVTMRREGFERVALAHTANDRNETFMLHLVRGSGTGGLTSMTPVGPWFLRPLVETSRAQIEAAMAAIRQTWRTDVTNHDVRFSRNRMRLEVLPALAAGFNPRLGETLARTIEILSAENDWMEEEAGAWVQAHRITPDLPLAAGRGTETTSIAIGELPSRHVAFQRRAIRAILRVGGSDLRNFTFTHLEQVRTLLAPGKSGRVIQLPGRLEVERSFDHLRVRPSLANIPDYEYELPIPGRIRVEEAGIEVEAQVLDPDHRGAGASANQVRLDGESIGPYVKIRNWKNGDTYDPAGLPRSKLKALFQERRIPRSLRCRWPVFVAQSSIVWVASFPVSHDFVPTERSRRIIQLEACPVRTGSIVRKPFADQGV